VIYVYSSITNKSYSKKLYFFYPEKARKNLLQILTKAQKSDIIKENIYLLRKLEPWKRKHSLKQLEKKPMIDTSKRPMGKSKNYLRKVLELRRCSQPW
jgi:hypothetical protein